MACAAIVDVDSVEVVRETLCPLRLPGQPMLHHAEGSDTRRMLIVHTQASIDSMHSPTTPPKCPLDVVRRGSDASVWSRRTTSCQTCGCKLSP